MFKKRQAPHGKMCGAFFFLPSIVLLCGLFLVPTSFSLSFMQHFDTFKLILLRFILLLAVFLFVMVPLKTSHYATIYRLYLFPLGYLVILGISIASAGNFITTLREGEKQLWPILFMLFLFYLPDKKWFIKQSIFSMIASGIIVSLYGIVQYLHFDPISWTEPSSRVFSTLGQANALGCFLSIPIGLVLGLCLQPLSMRKTIVLLVILLFNITCLAMSFTRGSWIALGIQLVIWLLLLRKISSPNNLKIITLSFIVCMITLAGFGFIHIFHQHEYSVVNRIVSSANITDESVETRLYLWKTALHIIKEHPWLGVGPGNFSYAHLLIRNDAPEHLIVRQAFPGSSHNEFLDIGVSMGVIGLLIYMSMWVQFFRYGITGLNNNQSNNFNPSLLLAGTGLIVNLCFIFASITILLLIWWLWGIMVLSGTAVSEQGTYATKPVYNKQLWQNKLLQLLVCLVIVTSFWPLVIAPFFSNYYERQGHNFLNHKKWNKGLEAYTKALDYDPINADLWQARGFLIEQIAVTTKNREFFELAKTNYEQAVKINPANPRSYANLGRLCGKASETFRTPNWNDCAIIYYGNAIIRDPYNPAFFHDRGIALKSGPSWNLAEQSFRECMKLASSHTDCALQLGQLYLEKDLPDKAVIILHYAHIVSNDDAIIAYWYAQALLKQGKDLEAKNFLLSKTNKYPHYTNLRLLLQSIQHNNAIKKIHNKKRE